MLGSDKMEKKKNVVDNTKVEETNNEGFDELTTEDRLVSIEKKVNATLILVVIMAILAIINLSILVSNNSGQTTTNEDLTPNSTDISADYDVSEFDEIKASDLSKESKNKTIVVYIGRSSCGYCVQFVPILKSVQEKYNFTTKYIDIAKIIDYNSSSISNQDAYNLLTNMKTNSEQKGIMEQFGSTPMTLVIKNNTIVDSIVGATDESTLTKLIEDNGFSKK